MLPVLFFLSVCVNEIDAEVIKETLSAELENDVTVSAARKTSNKSIANHRDYLGRISIFSLVWTRRTRNANRKGKKKKKRKKR